MAKVYNFHNMFAIKHSGLVRSKIVFYKKKYCNCKRQSFKNKISFLMIFVDFYLKFLSNRTNHCPSIVDIFFEYSSYPLEFPFFVSFYILAVKNILCDTTKDNNWLFAVYSTYSQAKMKMKMELLSAHFKNKLKFILYEWLIKKVFGFSFFSILYCIHIFYKFP